MSGIEIEHFNYTIIMERFVLLIAQNIMSRILFLTSFNGMMDHEGINIINQSKVMKLTFEIYFEFIHFVKLLLSLDIF